jgi:tRNA dimethylallyltransferase
MAPPSSSVASCRSSSSGRARTPSAAVSRASTTPDLPPLVVIAGATATGKTALSLRLASALPGVEIVCADSRQVFRGMDIGTAKPTAAERAAVPHHGLDLADPDEPFSAARYRTAALGALMGVAARGGLALLVGGTGLYLRAIGHGVPLDDTGFDPAIRAALEERLARDGLPALVGELRTREPTAAERIDLANPRRVVRALERSLVTGSAVPPAPRGYPGPVLWLGLRREGPRAAREIEARARGQFAGGLLDEAESLLGRYDVDLPAFSAIGYREAFDVLARRSDLEASIARTVARTRAYAKRQRTWFRAQPDIHWLDADDGPAARALDLIERSPRREPTTG